MGKDTINDSGTVGINLTTFKITVGDSVPLNNN